MFEILKSDLAGRIGILHTNHGKVKTPAFVPVIHPINQAISCSKIRQLGFDLVITNAYIVKNHYGQNAIEQGIHKIIGFDGPVMTDSGGYQVLEYGKVNASPNEIAEFESRIQADIAIPLDKPTGFGLEKKKAKRYIEQTLDASKLALLQRKDNGQIWVGPIQGGEHFGLVKYSAKKLVDFGFEMLALGSPVEFMESYEYNLLAEMIISARKQIPISIPLHLFGAGHPLTIPFVVALGCDTFDSASYMLYAKEGRYISEDRTLHLAQMENFSCNCEVCSNYTPKQLCEMDEKERINKLALHNLISIKSEVERVKEAIFEGRLWEYVMKKARSHPKLFETIEHFTTNYCYFLKSTPKFKEKAIFLFSKEDQFRPEVVRFHDFVRRFRTKKKTVMVLPEPSIKPAYLSWEYKVRSKKYDENTIQFCCYNPFLGIIPIEVSDIYPASHYVMANTPKDPKEFTLFGTTWNIFFKNNQFGQIYYNKKDYFISHFVKLLPNTIKRKPLNFKNKKKEYDNAAF